MTDPDLRAPLERIAAALDRLAPPQPPETDVDAADAFVWNPRGGRLHPVPKVSRTPLALLKGIDRARDILLGNTRRFAAGLPANNALLWGARGWARARW